MHIYILLIKLMEFIQTYKDCFIGIGARFHTGLPAESD